MFFTFIAYYKLVHMKMFGELRDNIPSHILTFIITLILNTLVVCLISFIMQQTYNVSIVNGIFKPGILKEINFKETICFTILFQIILMLIHKNTANTVVSALKW